MEEQETRKLKDHQNFPKEEKMSRPKRVKKTKTVDDFYVYSFKENQIAKTCEATGVKEESNIKNATRMTDFYSKACNDSSPDYKPGMDLKNQKLKKANTRKRKRDTKLGLGVDNRVALNHDSHGEKSNDDDGAFSAQSEEHHNSGLHASHDSQNNEISICRKNTRSMARRRSASSVGPVDGKHDNSRPTSQLPVPNDVPRKGRTTSSRKCKKNCGAAQSPPRNVKRSYTVIIEWLGLYSDEESDQEDVDLVNKRSERRKKLKMIKNRNYRSESLYQQSSSSSSDANESSSCANLQGNHLVFNVESCTVRANISPEEPEKLPTRTDCEDVTGCKLQGTCKLPSCDGATIFKSEVPMEAAVKSEPVNTATTSARYDVEDVIEISD